MKKYYTAKEVADLLEVTDRSVRRYVQKGQLEAEKDEIKYLICEESLFKFTYSREQFQPLLSSKIGKRYDRRLRWYKILSILERIKHIRSKNGG